MKKFLIAIAVLFILFIGLIFSIGKVRIDTPIVEKPFVESNFYKDYYSTNDLILVNVWATWCSPCIAEFPKLEKFQNNKSLKFISFSIDKDTMRLKKFLAKNEVVNNRDITLKNFYSLDSIFYKIELTGINNSLLGLKFDAKQIPYTVLIKNKKVLYKLEDESDIPILDSIIAKNLN